MPQTWATPLELGWFAGVWQLDRVLSDALSGNHGTFTGRATLTPDADGLAYRETGTLHWPTHTGPATRGYHYAASDTDPALLSVTFEDGRPFHTLDLRDGASAFSHDCGEDLYTGTFARISDDAWEQRWRVTGPRKDLLITSTYERATPDPQRCKKRSSGQALLGKDPQASPQTWGYATSVMRSSGDASA